MLSILGRIRLGSFELGAVSTGGGPPPTGPLPTAVYGEALMATSGLTVVEAATGTAFGNYTRVRQIAPFTPQAEYLEYSLPLSGTTALPTAVYGASLMATSGSTVILAASGTAYGQYARVYALVLNQPRPIAAFHATAEPLLTWPPPKIFTATAQPLASAVPAWTFTVTAAPQAGFNANLPTGPLPTAIYSDALMATSGATLVLAARGTSFGDYTRIRRLAPFTPQATYLEFNLALPGTTALPSAVYGASLMATSGSTVILAASGTAYGEYARVYRLVLNLPQVLAFLATGSPQVSWQSATAIGRFIARADPLAAFTAGLILLTADPLAAFAPIDNAYTAMGFTATADPLMDFTGAQVNGFLMTGAPLLAWFPEVGQSERCISKSGADTAPAVPTNYVF